jgi:hypothetical protein
MNGWRTLPQCFLNGYLVVSRYPRAALKIRTFSYAWRFGERFEFRGQTHKTVVLLQSRHAINTSTSPLGSRGMDYSASRSPLYPSILQASKERT